MDKNHTFYNEMTESGGAIRDCYAPYNAWFENQNPRALRKKVKDTETIFRKTGITFNVYGRKEATERLIPFDIVPRILTAQEWETLSSGIEQRVRAMNDFLHDVYHDQDVIKAGIIPKELITQNSAFLPHMIGMSPAGRVYTHIAGIDLVRTGKDEFYVLEDNGRTPSGVSYMLENRETMLKMFPELFTKNKVRPVSNYPDRLRQSLSTCAPDACKTSEPVIAVLTPGMYNSAYFEHAFLADEMGCELVEGHDLKVHNGRICMRTTMGFKPIDVIYRRIDDEFLDPLNFNPNSTLGVAGIMDIYRAGGVTIANAPGAGIADDKAIYSYMPDIIKFYSGKPAILKNVPTRRCSNPDDLAYVLEHLADLVVKEVHGSGGYGMLVGPAASRAELKRFRIKLLAKPENYIAQPTLALSTMPVLTKSGLAPRHLDLRPFVLTGANDIEIIPGGLTRVAMKAGSLVVNSSQGGGTKDTWVLG